MTPVVRADEDEVVAPILERFFARRVSVSLVYFTLIRPTNVLAQRPVLGSMDADCRTWRSVQYILVLNVAKLNTLAVYLHLRFLLTNERK